jgi:co-chaperonin GroES (HSP10)
MIIPLYDQMLVLPVSKEQTIEGILLPETSREDTKFGKVVATGEGYIQVDGSCRPLRLQTNDVIAFGMYAGIPARVEGIEFLIMKEGEALFKLEDDDA